MATFVLLIVDIFLHRLPQPWSSCLQTGQREKVQQKWKTRCGPSRVLCHQQHNIPNQMWFISVCFRMTAIDKNNQAANTYLRHLFLIFDAFSYLNTTCPASLRRHGLPSALYRRLPGAGAGCLHGVCRARRRTERSGAAALVAQCHLQAPRRTEQRRGGSGSCCRSCFTPRGDEGRPAAP